ncbi:MAG: DUF349 domain-containing protein [Bacteroidales bacterium]
MDELIQNDEKNVIPESTPNTGASVKTGIKELEEIAQRQRLEAEEEAIDRQTEEGNISVAEVVEVKSDEITKEEEDNVGKLDRDAIVLSLEDLYKQNKLTISKNMIALLRLKYREKTTELKKAALDHFLENGGVKMDFQYVDELEARFSDINQKIKDFHQKKSEELEKLMEENLKKKLALLEELKQLIELDQPLKKIYDEFNKLTETWREIKPIARTEANNLWQSYHFLVEKFFDKVKINNELRELDYKKNLEEKIQLCEKAESLLLEESLSKASKELHELHDRWKEIGPVFMEKKDEIWDRFKAASDTISQKRKDYYDRMQGEMEQNLLAKTALCEKMEALLTVKNETIKAWNETSTQADELMKLWKTIGRAPQKDNDTIWERFRSGINMLFENKKEYFQKVRDEQTNNYNLKINLCVQAENIAEQRVDWRVATADLLRLQQQWKEIGPVPYRLSDKIWKRFRSACDEFFRKKSEQYELMRGQEVDNMAIKETLIGDVKDLVKDTREALLISVKEIQRKWMEIGHVPMKEKDRLYAEFRSAIDEKFHAFGMNRENQRDIVGRIASIETTEAASKLSDKEVFFLNTKITQLRSDIHLWENNIGFLSNSKNAEILKQEFDKKIQKAKQDLALLEAKMKLIRNKSVAASNNVRNVGDGNNTKDSHKPILVNNIKSKEEDAKEVDVKEVETKGEKEKKQEMDTEDKSENK